MWAQDKNSLHGDRVDGEGPQVDKKLFGPLVLPSAQEEFYTQRGEEAIKN